MNTNIVTREDINFLAQQPTGNLNMILSGMTALLNDNDTKVAMLENQTWFQRMCRTVSGKNKMTQQEIQRNHDKINAYMTQAMTELYEQQCIDRQVMMSLGNQLNELYAEHLQLKQMLGAFVSKLNEKIESIDNFHMLNTEIEQGIYSGSAPIVSVCQVLSQMDKRCIQDYRKMNILQRSMKARNILNDDQISLEDYLMGIAEIPVEEAGQIYLELGSIRGNFMANLILNMMESYHFLPDMARKMKNKKLLVQSVIESEQLEPTMTLSISDVYDDLVTSKLDMIEGLIPISAIQYDAKLVEAERLFSEYKLDEAFEIFKTLADKGNGRAMYYLGEYYVWGFGSIRENEEEWIRWKKVGRETDDPLAILNSAHVLPEEAPERVGIFQEVFPLVLQLAKNGDAMAQYELADMYENGCGCTKNIDESLRWLKTSAEQGCWRAMNQLGYIFNYGVLGCTKDESEANKWYKKAAEVGFTRAQYALAVNLQGGYGCEKDEEAAFDWFEKAAQQGDSVAQNRVALCYDSGKGVCKDSEKAFYWFKKSAENGNANGQNNLAISYKMGAGCEKDEQAAFYWYEKAALQDHASAQNQVGLCYDRGRGVEKDLEKAFYWFKKSAKNGDKDGQSNLAVCYKLGDGCEKDMDKAKDWAMKAAEQGNEEAKGNLTKWFGVEL